MWRGRRIFGSEGLAFMNKNTEKQKLIEYLSHVRDKELEKPLEEINQEFVQSCVNVSLKLQGKDYGHTTEQIEENVNKIPFVSPADSNDAASGNLRKHRNAKKALFIAALVTILYAVLVTSIGYSESQDEDFIKYASEKIGIENIEHGKEYNINGITYIENEYLEYYEDIKKYPKNNPYEILLPTYLPEGTELKSLGVTKNGDGSIEINVACSTPDAGYTIHTDSKIPVFYREGATEELTINGKTVYVIYIADAEKHQMYFEYNGDYYVMSSNNKQELIKTIESMN